MNTTQRIATVTWISYHNYGTFLQAYALQHTLLRWGYDNRIIDDAHVVSPHKPSAVRLFLRMVKACIKGKLSGYNDLCYWIFKRRYLRIESSTQHDKLNQRYDVFLAGSDQIWSPHLPFEPHYYLQFCRKKKIAYAPSLGTDDLPESYIQKVKPMLESFTAIGVRERRSAEVLQRVLDKPAVHAVLDPTLLLTGDDWKKFIRRRRKTEGYILCYFLTPNQWYLDYVREYAARTHKKIKIFSTHEQYRQLGECVVAGPQEFLNYIYYADAVFTDSFHASIFSIIYHKPFIAFKRFEDGGNRDQNLRLYNLFEMLGIQANFVGKEQLRSVESLPKLNFDELEHKLDQLRNNSLLFLKNAIEST